MLVAMSQLTSERIDHRRLMKPKRSDDDHLNDYEIQFGGSWNGEPWQITVGLTDFDKLTRQRDHHGVPHGYARGSSWIMPFAARFWQTTLDHFFTQLQ
jgi:hypothetical protein